MKRIFTDLDNATADFLVNEYEAHGWVAIKDPQDDGLWTVEVTK